MNLSAARDEQMSLDVVLAELTKVCRRCGEAKPVAEFGFQRLNRDGLKPYCAPCQSTKAREWQKANPVKTANAKHNTYYKRYATRFSVWKLDGTLGGLHKPYIRTVQADPCSYCGGPGGCADHIVPVDVPRSKRGDQSFLKVGDWDDLTGACYTCNTLKGRASLLEFLGWPSGWLS